MNKSLNKLLKFFDSQKKEVNLQSKITNVQSFVRLDHSSFDVF